MKKSQYLLGLVGLFGSSSASAAAITVVFAPASIGGIPTLSGGMLLILSLLLAAVAFRIVKQHQSGTSMLLGIIGVTALMSGAGGVKLLSDAQAGIIPTPLVGGSVTVDPASFFNNFFINSTGVAQTINSVSSGDGSCPDVNLDIGLSSGFPHCSVGLTLADGDICYVRCNNIIVIN